MAYYTGIAQTPVELLSVLQSACVANGWALASNNVLSKNNCYVKAAVSGNTVALVGSADNAFTIYSPTVSHSGIGQDISYPLTYHIHVNNMEVYFFINFNVNFYSFLNFGQSPFGDLPGTGNWVSGMYNGGSNMPLDRSGGNSTDNNSIFNMMFNHFNGLNGYQKTNSYFHHGINGQWSGTTDNEANSRAFATLSCFPLLRDQPNAWNSESLLIPIRPMIYYAEGRKVHIGQLQYAFYVRIDNYDPEQIITIGDTKYKIYPWVRKNSSDRNLSGNNYTEWDHSGTYGLAVVYEGD